MSENALKHENRLRRQFHALASGMPVSRQVAEAMLERRMRLIRLPLAAFFLVGALVSVLPVFGLWMAPVGLLLLAVDVPSLRPQVSAAVIRGRRRLRLWRRRRADQR